jgi:hypothetical protein
MKQLDLFLLMGMVFLCVGVSPSFAADSCIPVQPSKTGSAILKKPGNYCLAQNMTIEGSYKPWNWEGPNYLSKDDIALVIAASDVHVDLNGKTILSTARDIMAGAQSALISTGESTNQSIRETYRENSWNAAYRNISIRNGSIDLKRGRIGLAFSGSSRFYGWTKNEIPVDETFSLSLFADDRLTMLPPTAASYPIRNITLENLKIRSPSYGVVVQGAKTIIRNSVIETDSQVGIWIFGPGAIIENNTIIVHERDKDSIYPIRPHDAPIRLHQADGTIIRNNRIIMRTGWFSRGKGTAAIDLLDSKDVRIENNTVEDFQELLRKDNTSSAVENANKLR